MVDTNLVRPISRRVEPWVDNKPDGKGEDIVAAACKWGREGVKLNWRTTEGHSLLCMMSATINHAML